VEVRLEGPSSVTTGKPASYRIRAQNALTRNPVPNAKVSLDLLAQDGTPVGTTDGVTSATGEAFFPMTVQSGTFQLKARTTQSGVTPTVQDSVKSALPGPKVFLTSDKPIYQPGQTLHLRSLTLTSPDDKPVAGTAVLFDIEDGKGNKVFKKQATTDAYGVASMDFTLGTLVNMGTFTLNATAGASKTSKTVNVSNYALPKFDVSVATDKTWYRAGDTVTGTLDARYFFGKNVAGGDVVIQASTLDVGQTPFQKVMGTLDAAGHFPFMVTLPGFLVGTQLNQGNASVDLQVTVTDTAGQVVVKDVVLTVSPSGLLVTLVPESTDLVPGLPNELDVFVADPLGSPIAGAAIAVTDGNGNRLTATTDAYGQGHVTWQAPATISNGSFNVQVSPTGGAAPVAKTFSFTEQSGAEHLIVRTDASVYKFGDTVKVDVVASDAAKHVYVDWLNDGQAIAMRTLDAAGGHASFTMNVDASLTGSNRIEAYVVDPDGNIVRAGRTVFVTTDASLAVSMTQDQPTYTPGGTAKLKFAVQDSQGKPAVAALGVEIVDQAVFALVDAHPGLLRSYFELESTYATPTYVIAAPPVDFNQLLFGQDADPGAAAAHQTLTKAAFAALGEATVTGISHGSWTDVSSRAVMLLQPVYSASNKGLEQALRTVAKSIADELNAQGCQAYGGYGSSLDCGTQLSKQLALRFSAYDFWGNPYSVTGDASFNITMISRGPDETAGTTDDNTDTVYLGDLFPGAGGFYGEGALGGGPAAPSS
jgi:hypothetical protein